MNKRFWFLGQIFFLLLSNFGIFCMDSSVSQDFTSEALTIQNMSIESFRSIKFEFNFFEKIVSEYICTKFASLSCCSRWFDIDCPFCIEYKDFCKDYLPHNIDHKIFYAQKLFVGQKVKIINITDLHGDFDSLIVILADMIAAGYIDKDLKITDNCFFIGLGDYVDRRPTSLLVLALLLMIALKNPDKVILLRGNHEDLNLNLDKLYDIDKEIMAMFGENFIEKTHELLIKLYELMPSVLYLAQFNPVKQINEFLIFSHGLLGFKFSPREFLDFNNLELAQHGGTCFCNIKQNIFGAEAIIDPCDIGHGFVWHDVGLFSSAEVEYNDIFCRYKYSPRVIESFCRRYVSDKNIISGIIGGHDHYFAKKISDALGNGLMSSVGYAWVAHGSSYVIGNEFRKKFCEKCTIDGITLDVDFMILKFVSASVDQIVYPPSYLVISNEKDGNDFIWNYQFVECYSYY